MLRMMLLLAAFFAVNTLLIWWLPRQKPGVQFSCRSLARLLGLGALAGIVPVLFSFLMPDFHGMHPLLCGFLTGLVKYALLKELFKYVALRFTLRNAEEIVCRLDVVIAACLLAVGFTLTEGIITVFFSGANGLMMTILPYHVLFATIMGFFFGRALAAERAGGRAAALAVPILLHTVFELWHLALFEAADVSRLGTMTAEQIRALPYLSLVPPLNTLSVVSYAVFTFLTLLALVLIGIWGKREMLRESILRSSCHETEQ